MTRHGFLNSTQRAELKDVQHPYIHIQNIIEFLYGRMIFMASAHGRVKMSYWKIRHPFITFHRNERKDALRKYKIRLEDLYH